MYFETSYETGYSCVFLIHPGSQGSYGGNNGLNWLAGTQAQAQQVYQYQVVHHFIFI